MPKMDVSVEELLQMIAKQQIIIERQGKALDDLSELYNKQNTELEDMKKEPLLKAVN
jgi:hypothetical protein